LERDNNIDLLLDCLGRKDSTEVAARLKSASKSEWQQLMELALQHEVGPLLYSRLKILFADHAIPPGIMVGLHNSYLENAARNTLFYHELANLLESLKKVNIPVIVLKGAYLAEKIYEDIALRPMLDIDLLLKKNDLARGKEILINLGYSQVKQIDSEFEITVHHHISRFIKGSRRIELHWHISPPMYPFSVDINQVWERALEQKVSDHKVLVLSPENLLLHLCMHTSNDDAFESGLRFLYDIKMVLEKFKDVLQWNIFIQRAFAWKAERCAYLALSMVQNLFAVELPENMLEKLKPAEIPPNIFSMVDELLFARGFENYEISTGLSQMWKAEKPGERISLFLKRIFISRQEIATKYPVLPGSPRRFMYYPVRFKYLLFRYGRGALGLAKKNEAALGLAEHKLKEKELRKWLGGR